MMSDGGFQSASVKREACDDIQDEGPAKRPRSGGRAVNVRFLVQSKNAGAIIGKGGSNINRLRTEYKASVTVPDCPGPERILAIVADAETLGDILLDIIPKLDDYAHNQTMDFDCELRMLLHQSHAGCLIGKGGSRIKELREKTGSQIKIFSNCCPNSTERIVQINGVPNVVVNCVKEVCSLINQAPIKGPNKQYDPHHFNPMFANDYGGYEENMQKGRGGRGGFRGRPSGGRGGRGGRGGGGGGGGGGRVWSDESDFGFGGHDGGQGGGYGGNPFGGRGQGLMGQVPGGMGNRWNQGSGPSGGGGGGGGGIERQWAEDTDTGFGGPGRNRMLGNMNGSGNGGFMGPSGMGDSQMGGGPRAGMMSNTGMGGGFQGGPGMNGPGGNRFMGPRSPGFVPPVPGTGELFSSKPVGGLNGSTCRMKIPNDVAGAIIGKGGQRIRKIRRDSAATINIEEATQGSNDRIITITGAMNQVQMAQYLMQQSVRDNQGGRRF